MKEGPQTFSFKYILNINIKVNIYSSFDNFSISISSFIFSIKLFKVSILSSWISFNILTKKHFVNLGLCKIPISGESKKL